MKTISLKLAKEIYDIAKERMVELPKAEVFSFKNQKIQNDWEYGALGYDVKEGEHGYNSYTIDELLEMLPDRINNEVLNYSLSLRKLKYTKEEQERSNEILPIERTEDVFYEAYIGEPSREEHTQFVFKADTPVEALGLLFKELLKKDLIK